jgi:hypothetical protein
MLALCLPWNILGTYCTACVAAAAAAAAAAAGRLQARSYKALIVGGWVRDKYLGRRASDIDIATNATPWEVRGCYLTG